MELISASKARLPFGLSWEKAIIWTLFGGVLYSLRHFFDIAFMTFIMSYLASRLVGGMTETLTRRREHWLRKPILTLIYFAALTALYFTVQFVLPRAIEQGKWLLGQVQELNLDRMRDEVLAKTLGRIELTRYKLSSDYDNELNKFIEKKLNLPSYEAFRQTDGQIRQAFRDELSVLEGRRLLEESKQAGHLKDLYQAWLLKNRVTQELASRPELRQRLESKFDEAWRNIYGEERLAQERSTPTYLELRDKQVLQSTASELEQEARYREEAEAQIALGLGLERVAAMRPEEMEPAFRAFYERELPKRWGEFPFGYDKLIELEQVSNEQEYRVHLGTEATDHDSLRRKFDEIKELEMARKHPWSVYFGDTSQLMRENLPTITAWLTDIINNVLGFGLNALLALMFSFFIVWEVPRFRRSLELVHGTRAEPAYSLIAPGVQRLAVVVGTGFSAQIVIATFNACFTFIGLQFLGVGSPLFLSLMVLFFSLVPYFGVLISTVPILLVGLQQGGTQLGLYAGLWMFFVHSLEAWILSPKILGDMLQLNPLVVMIVLFGAQQLFGVWGLLLGVPVTVFILNDVLLKPIVPKPRNSTPS